MVEVAATNKTTGAKAESRLAILGGEPVRNKPMPPRRALGDDEVAAIHGTHCLLSRARA